MSRTDRRHKPVLLIVMSATLLLAIACASATPISNDPPGYSCEYSPFGDGTADISTPTREQMAQFDYFVKVRVTGHLTPEGTSAILNIVTVEESVFGPAKKGDELRLQSGSGVCLETGASYYLSISGDGTLLAENPWSIFPVINNRITLHPDMRKDMLVGDFHGLDPVLFKRRFFKYVGRTDVDPD